MGCSSVMSWLSLDRRVCVVGRVGPAIDNHVQDTGAHSKISSPSHTSEARGGSPAQECECPGCPGAPLLMTSPSTAALLVPRPDPLPSLCQGWGTSPSFTGLCCQQPGLSEGCPWSLVPPQRYGELQVPRSFLFPFPPPPQGTHQPGTGVE